MFQETNEVALYWNLFGGRAHAFHAEGPMFNSQHRQFKGSQVEEEDELHFYPLLQ